MATRKMFTILLVANLLTVALVTMAFQAGGVVKAGLPQQAGGIQATAHDANLVPVVPWYMNYQGILKDSNGALLSGQHDLTFTIYRYNQGVGNTAIWTETHNDVQVTNGLFTVSLGIGGNPLRGGTFAGMGVNGTWDGDLALGVRVDGGVELSPRFSLGSVPYAQRAEYVDRFPAPHYNSGWTAISQGQEKVFTHNLGGNVDDYVVDVQFKDTSGSNLVHQLYYGGDFDGAQAYGANWYKLSSTSITVWRASDDTTVGNVRVRIWRIQ